jgi:hypothetical protein
MNRKGFIPATIVIILATLACGKSAQPTDELQPAPIPIATQTTAADNPCANVLLPFAPGYQWIYQVEREEQDKKIGLTVSTVENSQATLDMLDISTGVIVQTIVECEDGAIKNYPTLSLGMLFSEGMQGDMTITYVSGIYMPSEEEFQASNWNLAWVGEYIANGSLMVDYEGETATITLEDSPVRMEWQIAGQEPVTIQAGTYNQAYKLIRRTEMDGKVDMGGFLIQGTMIIETGEWYQVGLGLLKSEVDTASFGFGGITFPVYMKGEVELVEFRSDQ